MTVFLIKAAQLFLSLSNPYLWGAAAAILAAYKSGSVYWTIGAGMLAFIAFGQLI